LDALSSVSSVMRGSESLLRTEQEHITTEILFWKSYFGGGD
jgi:hypothetical protein